jgi:hypothetical protein
MRARANATPPPALSLASALELQELVVHREPGRDPLLGCAAVRRFLEVDDDTLRALDAMRAHPTLGEAETALQRETGESWDLVALAERLRRRGFVRRIDGVDVATEPPAAARHPLLYNVPPKRVRWLHHPLTFAALGLVALAWIATWVGDPALRPRTTDLFLFERPGLVFLSTTLGFLAFAYLHELAHFFVARSHGVDPRIKLGHRLYVLTLETDVTNAWTLSRGPRIQIFLAGMTLNVTLAAIAGLLVAGISAGIVPGAAWIPVLRFVAMLNLAPLILQLFFFTRTDLYFVLMTATGDRNLLRDARGYVRLLARRVARRASRAPSKPCPGCGLGVYDDEPFCVRCGRAHEVADVNQYPYDAASRRRLLGFGLFFYAGQIAGLALLLLVGLRFQVTQILGAFAYGWGGYHAGDWLTVSEGALSVALATLQLAFISWFLARDWGGRLARARLSSGPPQPHVAAVAPVAIAADATKRVARKKRKNRMRRQRRR